MVTDQFLPEPGLIILFGSGETSPSGRKIFEEVFRSLPQSPRLALLETPAGFEPNSNKVIGRVGDFFTYKLQNYSPQVEIIPARKKGTPFSPDDPDIVRPLLNADLIFMGPGSPTYTVRQLRDSLAWYYLMARHRLGGVLALASAATVAFSAYALPVYEIYKAGSDLYWTEGLDFFRLYGLKLVFIPHWNNHEGGADLDTSRCFMGQERFIQLMEMLQDDVTIIGLDEKTALIMDPSRCLCQVKGVGKVTILHFRHNHLYNQNIKPSAEMPNNLSVTDADRTNISEQRIGLIHQYWDGQVFPMSEIGPFHAFHPESSLPPSIWQKAIQVNYLLKPASPQTPPEEVILLMQSRNKARRVGDWQLADELRERIEMLGWELLDTKDGPVSRKITST